MSFVFYAILNNFFQNAFLEPLEDIAEEAEESQEECDEDKSLPPKTIEDLENKPMSKERYGLCAKALYDYQAGKLLNRFDL